MYYGFGITWLVFGIWVYMDAKRRNLKSPISHAILAFLFGIIGVLVYYFTVIKPNKTDI